MAAILIRCIWWLNNVPIGQQGLDSIQRSLAVRLLDHIVDLVIRQQIWVPLLERVLAYTISPAGANSLLGPHIVCVLGQKFDKLLEFRVERDIIEVQWRWLVPIRLHVGVIQLEELEALLVLLSVNDDLEAKGKHCFQCFHCQGGVVVLLVLGKHLELADAVVELGCVVSVLLFK